MGGVGDTRCDRVAEAQPQSEPLGRAAARASRIGRSWRYAPVEIERFVADLSLATRRLVSREYRQSSFQPRNLLRIPERTEELFNDLTFYWSVGQVWREIFAGMPMRQDARVAEVGCGYVPKVALGLHYAGFTGTVDLVDTDGEALSHAARFLELVGARCSSTTQAATLGDPHGRTYDALFGNHLLDDLVLSAFCVPRGIEGARLYEREDRYMAVWSEIINDSTFAERFVPDLADTLVGSVRPDGIVVLLDYPSFTHRALRLTRVIKFVREVALNLRRALVGRGATLLAPLKGSVTFDRLAVTPDDLVAFRSGGSNGEL